ncbi:bestrophin family protein [Amaricoccus solimangrovi]|uniref:Bestrophin n=1 Tax=Amaricoccus solimangrovi TaxID=2589815 RepID=A0A501W9G0_9RHOB|nr:bestrophin family ion channel [Amaricoccus solimangrovi]TPE46583.1 bestrophin [Amaricoccus solimangrovi]
MIVRPRPSIWKLFFLVRGSILPRVLPRLVLVFLLSLAIVWGHRAFPGRIGAIDGAPFALVGIALSVFLGSRNAACYERWWEGRKVWGAMIAAARDFARATLILGPEAPARRRLLSLTIAFAQAMVPHLRRSAGHDRVLALLPGELHATYRASRNPPDAILRAIAEILAEERRAGRITDIEWQVLDAHARALGEAQAACERIRTTPVPFAYTVLLHRIAFLFCVLLPFGFVDALGYVTPLVGTLVAYAVFGLDALGDELERPFDAEPNALPIQALADTLEINLREAMGQAVLPEAPKPVGHVLM